MRPLTFPYFSGDDQQKAMMKTYDMWDNMASKTKEYMEKNYPGNFQRMEIEVAAYKKQAPTSNDKGVQPETEIIVEDTVQREHIDESEPGGSCNF